MTSLFYPPKFDSALAGSKLTFTITGTTTAQNTYQEEALTTPHANPVVADTNGVFAPIYLDPTLPSYRVKWTTAANVLIYQTDGVPSNQNIQQSIRLESTNPFLFLYDTDGTSGSRKYRIRAAGNAFEVQASNDAESVFTTILQFTGGVLYSNATEVAVTSSGTFTGTLTGVVGTVTGTINYRKVNNMVTLWATNDIVGTSNSTSFTMTGLPVAVRSLTKVVPCILQDNTQGSLGALAVLNTASIDFMLARTDLLANHIQHSYSGFTNGGSKGIPSGWMITYAIT